MIELGYDGGANGNDTGAANGNDVVNGNGTGDTNKSNVVDKNQQTVLDGNGNNDEPDDLTPNNKNSNAGGNAPAEGKGTENGKTTNDANKADNGDKGKEVSYEPGTIIEADGVKYTIDANGDAIDSDGVIFKKSDELTDWLNTFANDDDVLDDPNAISIDAIKKALNVQIVDEQGKTVDFDNTPEGVVGYVNSVIESAKEDIVESTINTLYTKYPILENVINYYVSNGNSLEGFGEVKDRTNIVIDAKNEAQQESIIRTAWAEQNRKGDVDGYLQYIKSQNQLLDVANEELKGLQERDKEYLDSVAEKAEKEEQEAIERQNKYWADVKSTINNRTIAGFKLPETIVIDKNGQKISATPNDFFNYIYQVDSNGKSKYEYDLAKEDPKEKMNNELLSAYIKFSGGNYSSLINMAVHENNVKTIRLKSASKPTGKTKITVPTNNVTKDIDLGFN